MGENAFRWLDDAKNFTTRDAMRKMIDGLVGSPEGRLDPADMIARIVEVVPAAQGAFRNIHPAFVEEGPQGASERRSSSAGFDARGAKSR